MKRVLVALFAIATIIAIGVCQRHVILIYALPFAETPPLSGPSDEGPLVRWHNDYFTIQSLDENTFAIGEPRYYQQNYSYLIVGSERAVLFDAGPGYRDIRPVAQSLTDLPITFVPSHFHYDHIGNQITFDRVAVIDLPYLRTRAPDDRLLLTTAEHLGVAEGFDIPTLLIDEWLAPDSEISLGNRTLRVIHTPGHTEDSISLVELETGFLFTGDFIYPGPLFAFLPNSGMGDYLQGADSLLRVAPATARLFGAHRDAPPGAPELQTADVVQLQSALRQIERGELASEGIYPAIYPISSRIELYAEPRWLQNWTPRHPPPQNSAD